MTRTFRHLLALIAALAIVAAGSGLASAAPSSGAQGAGISAMPVLDGDDLRRDAHLAARGAIVTVQHPEVGAERHAANPIRLSRTPLAHAGPSPLLGADTAAVLGDWLGLAPAAVAELEAQGICR